MNQVIEFNLTPQEAQAMDAILEAAMKSLSRRGAYAVAVISQKLDQAVEKFNEAQGEVEENKDG